MFDGLKEKLGKFRSDAEEVAEEKAEKVEASEEADATDETASEGEAATDAGAATEAGASTGPEAVEGATAADAAEESEEVGEPDEVAEPADADDADDTAEDGSSGIGFVGKAKSAMRGRVVIEEEDLEDPLWELEMALLESDVEMSVAEEILDTIRDDLIGEERTFRESTSGIIEDALRDALLSVMSVGQFDFEEKIAESEKPVVIVFTGVNGVGKTTSIAKLSRYLEERGYSSVLANGDTYRAGANEQIREHAETLGTKLISHEQGGDPAAVIYDAVEYAEANDVDVVLGDTAGRLHTSDDLMEQLAKIHRVVDPDMTIFVDEAVAGQDAVNRAREFDDAAEIDGSILTMADADAQGGAAISIAYVTGKPILFLGTGQGYDDIERFDPDALVDELLGE